ncbi:hypothetical protein [Streptomyces termitum]|uniref:hypothetical protein n=1 Tax=Streptomyces termitum TaxID=67368 RepID=UPI00378CB058
MWRTAAAVCLAALAAGCTGPAANEEADSVTEEPWPGGVECGLESPARDDGLLSAREVWPGAGRTGRSARVVDLDRVTCATGRTPATMRAGSCDTSGFPWAGSPAATHQELYSSGVRRWAYASLEGPDGGHLREHVLIPSDGESGRVVAAYRKQVESCAAEVLDAGGSSRFLLKGSPALAVSFRGGRVTALQGYGSGWGAARLNGLLAEAEKRGGSLAEG